jgi:hypothetical protein
MLAQNGTVFASVCYTVRGTSVLPTIATTIWSQPKKTRIKNIRRDASGIMKDREVSRITMALIGKLIALTIKIRSIGSTLL